VHYPVYLNGCCFIDTLALFPVDLYLGPNLLTSTLPKRIDQLENLSHLYINECALHGTIPTEIGRLTKLRKFPSSYFSYSFQIPRWLS
jgi:hypothetical protein